ncbi:hypothetical protein SNF32_09240 [Enterococcus mundtii]|nr:hypothetical protein [Enterococcus mundtii]
MGVIENRSIQTTQSTAETTPQTFEDYLIENQYLEAAETFPEKKKTLSIIYLRKEIKAI